MTLKWITIRTLEHWSGRSEKNGRNGRSEKSGRSGKSGRIVRKSRNVINVKNAITLRTPRTIREALRLMFLFFERHKVTNAFSPPPTAKRSRRRPQASIASREYDFPRDLMVSGDSKRF
jgi:hypothetical protein